MARLILCIGGVLLLAGCAGSMGNLAVLSTRSAAAPTKVVRRGVSGEDCAHKIIGIPLGQGVPSLNAAVAAAVDTVPGGAMLTNVSVDNDYVITGIYNRSCIRVTGDVAGK